MNVNQNYYRTMLLSNKKDDIKIKYFIIFLLNNNEDFYDKVIEKINRNYYDIDNSKINLNKYHIELALKEFNEDDDKKRFKNNLEQGKYKLSYYWNQIYKLFKKEIDDLYNEQYDRTKLKVEKNFSKIKYIIEKYNIKDSSEQELKKRGIDSISDKDLLYVVYDNLIDEEDYKGAEYIVNLLNDKSLKLKFEKDRVQQGEFKFGTVSAKLDFLSRMILRA